jgi:hypothetical protein
VKTHLPTVKFINSISRIAIVAAVIGQIASASITYVNDDFNRVGNLAGSSPSTIIGGSLVWAGAGVQTDGSGALFSALAGGSDDREVSIPFVIQTGSVTTISVVLSAVGGTWSGGMVGWGGWLGVGLLDSSSPNPGIFSSSGPLIALSGDGSVYTHAAYLASSVGYAGYAGASASNVTLGIEIDTRNTNAITATFLRDGSVLGMYNFGSSGFTSDSIILRSYLATGGTVDSLSVSVASVPDGAPGGIAWINLGTVLGLSALIARHSKRRI